MLKTKLFASILLIAAVLFAQVGAVAAASPAQDTTPISGTIQTITVETDANEVTTVVVNLLDDQGATQTVRLSVDEAAELGLVEVDPATNLPVIDETTGLPVVDETKLNTTIEIPAQPTEEVPVHPISELLADFFGMDAVVVDEYHEDGYGFGVIAQALWMSKNLSGDATTAGLILEAKKTGDYSAFTLPDGSTPTNWGQFKKDVSEKKNNLGSVVSGKADKDTADQTAPKENGKDKNKDKSNNGKNKP
jgi:hypothetical protein